MKYNLFALGWAILCPVWITIKSYAIRKYATDYNSFDMGIDGLIFEYLCYSLFYIVYVKHNGFTFI